MYCSHCGREVPEGQVCSCQFAPPPPPPPAKPQGVCAVNPVVAAIKTIGRSPMFLIVCILQSAAAALSLLDSFVGLFDMIDDYAFSNYSIDFWEDNSPSFDSFVPAALIALGLWLIYATCKSDASPMVKTGGLTLIKVLLTIELVAFYIAGGVVAILIPCVFLVAEDVVYELQPYISEFTDELDLDLWLDPSFISIVAVIVLVILLIAVVFIIVSITATLKSLKTVRENFEGILTDRSVSMLTVVIGFIVGGFSLPVFTDIEESLIYALSSLCAGGALILLSLIALKYRKEMDNLRFMSMMAQQPIAAQGAAYAAPPVPMTPFVPDVPAAAPVMQESPVAETSAAEEPVPEVPVAETAAVEETVPEAPVAETTAVEEIVPETPVAETAAVEEAVPEAPVAETPVVEETRAFFCTGCGHPLKEGQRFCAHCGHPTNQ